MRVNTIPKRELFEIFRSYIYEKKPEGVSLGADESYMAAYLKEYEQVKEAEKEAALKGAVNKPTYNNNKNLLHNHQGMIIQKHF